MLTLDEGKELIDIYGPHRARWPASNVPSIDALVAADPEFQRYLKAQLKIDKQLSDWEEAVDGASIDDEDIETEGDEDFDAPDQDEEEEEDPGDQQEPDADEDDGIGPIHLDDRDLGDMDQQFADAIQALIDNHATGNFNVFSRDQDALHDIYVPQGVTTENIDKSVQQAVGPLMKDLRRLIAAQSQVRRIPGKRSGRLHAASLHRIKVGDDRVFSRKEESQSLSTAITLLLDNSGSMSGPRLKLATETAYALATVLNKLGIAFECIGFTTRPGDQEWNKQAYEAAQHHPIARVNPLVMPKYKAFEERWTIPVMQRFGHIFNGGAPCRMGDTPEGCALEFAAKRLLQRPEQRKILLCMTDGEPGTHGAGCGWQPGLYVNQSRRMVESIALAGVDIVGIGIQHAGPTNYYPNALVIQNVGEMPKLLMGVLKRFLIGK
jgi:cobalamin biosynthesis protein CobT